MSGKIKVVIVDDQQLAREGLKCLLEKQRRYAVVGQASNGRAAIRLIRRLSPDIVLLDMQSPQVTGLEARRRIQAVSRYAKVIVLSKVMDARAVSGIMAAGALAYIAKTQSARELSRAIDAVYAGKAGHTRRSEAGDTPLRGRGSTGELSARLLQPLKFVAIGMSSKDIAEEFGVSVKSVEVYRRHLRQKLGRSNIAELTRYAIEKGLVRGGTGAGKAR